MGLNTGKNDKAGKQRTATGRPRSLNRGGGVIEATKAAFVWAKDRDFESWHLNKAGRLIHGRYIQVRL